MGASLRILLVDDDEEEYILVQDLLADRSYRSAGNEPARFVLDWVSTYDAALQAFSKGQHDVYLVDYQLDHQDGLQLLRQAVAGGCMTPIIMMTGQGNYALDLEAMNAGATDYLAKEEVTAPLLERTIRYAIEQKKTEEMLRKAQDELEARVKERTSELGQANQQLKQINKKLRAEICDRERAEQALAMERQRLFSLLDELPGFIYLQAPDFSIRFANSHFRQQFGDPGGRCCYEIVQNSSSPCENCRTFSVFNTQQPVEWEWTTADGKSFQIYDYPFKDVDGSMLVMELGMDITQRKQVEAQLVQAEKYAAIGRMVASVAHELNNPLQTIKNCLFLTQQEIGLDHAADAYLEMASSETKRLSRLVTQLLELYRPRKMIPEKAINLLNVLQEVNSLLQPQLLSSKVGWEQHHESGELFVSGIADQLKQLFLNISTNAIEAMHPMGGTLAVELNLVPQSVPREIPKVRIQFKDTGPGISQENMSKLFEPFFTTKPNGLGLGLSICYEIVERHNGKISVESKLGQGTVFTILLPRAMN